MLLREGRIPSEWSRTCANVELAKRWDISPRTLERWRWLGEGPPFLKLGGARRLQVAGCRSVRGRAAARQHHGPAFRAARLGPGFMPVLRRSRHPIAGNSAPVPSHGRYRRPAAVCGAAAMTAKLRLEADRAELARFVDATFRYADDGTDAVLRTFAEGSNEVLGIGARTAQRRRPRPHHRPCRAPGDEGCECSATRCLRSAGRDLHRKPRARARSRQRLGADGRGRPCAGDREAEPAVRARAADRRGRLGRSLDRPGDRRGRG